MAEALNRYGQCPICEHNWDGGDIVEVLSQLDVFKGKPLKEIQQMAEANYGYTEASKPRFTRLISVDLLGIHTGKGLWQCPACNNVWDKVTFEHYPNLKGAYGEINRAEADQYIKLAMENTDEGPPPFEI